MERKAEITSRTITDFSLHSNPGIQQIQLHAEINAGFGVPKDENSTIGLIHAILELKAENEEDYKLVFVEDLEVRFDERPKEFQKTLHAFFEREGIRQISDDLDKALEGLGKQPMMIKNTY